MVKALKGAYVLLLKFSTDKELKVGSLGTLMFERGVYAYVGSALGGLEARVRRHFSREKRKRWHIDYLLDEAEAIEAFLVPGTERYECELNVIVGTIAGARKVAEGFGSSDCGCPSHLHLLTQGSLGRLRLVSEENGWILRSRDDLSLSKILTR